MPEANPIRPIRWEDLPRERLNAQLERRIITGEKAMLTHVYLQKGCVVPMHQHENEQITYILEGSMHFWFHTTDAVPVLIRAGEVFVIPANVPHQAEALADTLDVDIFAPPRADWLNKTDDYLRQK